MPNQHKNPLLGWNCPADLAAWVRAEADRRSVPLKDVLTEALVSYRRKVDPPRARFDPCPRCGREVTGFSQDAHMERDNPEAVISVGAHVVVNPAPNPMLDQWFSPYSIITLEPCGDQFQVSKGYMGDLAAWQVHEEWPDGTPVGGSET